MAFTCSPTVSHIQINGHHFLPKYGRNGHALSSAKTNQKHQNHLALMWGCSSSAVKLRCKSSYRVLSLASSGKDAQEDSSDSREESSGSPQKQTIQLGGSEAPSSSSPSPFVGAKISSRIAARTSEATNKTAPVSAPPPPIKSPSSEVASPGNISSFPGAEKLKNATPSVFLDPRASSKELASKSLLDALKRADLKGKTTKFGQPMVPTNLFDEPKMVPPEQKKFEFSLNAGQLVLVFSFLTIIAIMFGTAYVVWKLGGIHYDEY